MTLTTRQLQLLFTVIGCGLFIAACGSSTQSGAPPPVQANAVPAGDPRFLAADLPLLPDGIVQAVAPVQVMRATYEFAARHPEVMHFIPCFCGCERGGHTSNHDCFVAGRTADGKVTSWDTHAIGCEICVDVAHTAWQMHNSGASVSAIRDAIEKRYAAKTAEGLHTPTAIPKKGTH